MHNHLLAGTVLLALASVVPAHAAQSGIPSTNIDPVVVTASRSAEPESQALAAVTVITRADIARLQPASMDDLLSGLPGVTLANSGGIGQQTSLFLRGTNSDHVLVLVDGVRIGSVGAGLAALEQIPVDQIQRIEVVRGPRSSLYGSDAIGGVIQIFTRHGKAGQAARPSFAVTAGSHAFGRVHGGLSGGSAHGWYNASVGAEYTAGINSCRLGAGTRFVGCFTNEPDTDGYRSHNVLLNGGYRWDGGTELAGDFMRTGSFVHYDGSYQNQSRHAQQVAGARLDLPVSDAWRMHFELGQSRDNATNYKNGAYVGYGNSRRDQATWQNGLTLAAGQQLVLGLDDQHQQLDSSTAYVRTRRNDVGVYAQYQGTFGANELQLSARHDHNQQFGDHVTGAAAWGYTFDDGLKLTASWGTAFHAPTFNDLYYPSSPGFPPAANPDLKPETSRSAELDLGSWHAHWSWQLAAYRTDINDLIGYNAYYTPVNVSRARIRGVEGQFRGDWAGWTVHGDMTWQQPRNNDGGPNDGHLLARRFQRSARVDLDRRLGRFSVGTTLRAFSYRYDNAANTHRLGGYALVDLRGTWHVAPHWKAQVRLANLFDRDYETVYYYNQPGRTAYLTLRYTPSVR